MMTEHIQMKLNINDIYSHLPGILNGYLSITDNYGFQQSVFSSVSGETNGNYNLIVSDIEIPLNISSAITDNTDIYINLPTSYSGSASDKIIYGEYFTIENKSASILSSIQNRITNNLTPKYYYIDNNNIYEYNDTITINFSNSWYTL